MACWHWLAMGTRTFWNDEAGQDLIEYSLLISFIVLVAGAVFPFNQQAISTIISKTDEHLTLAIGASH